MGRERKGEERELALTTKNRSRAPDQ